MASKTIGVLTENQPHGQPAYHITGAEADRRVSTGEADRLTRVLIRMRPSNSYAHLVASNQKVLDLRRMAMPPAEVAGCHFTDPLQSPNTPRMMFLSRREREQQYPV